MQNILTLPGIIGFHSLVHGHLSLQVGKFESPITIIHEYEIVTTKVIVGTAPGIVYSFANT